MRRLRSWFAPAKPTQPPESTGDQASPETATATPSGQRFDGAVSSQRDFVAGNSIRIVNHYHAASGQTHSKEDIARQLAGYLCWLVGKTESIELRGIASKEVGSQVVRLPLEKAYVPLRARAMPSRNDGLIHNNRLRGGRDLGEGLEADREERDIALGEALGLGYRLAIVGGPGSGKTTVLLHIAWALATSLLGQTAEPARSRLGLDIQPGQLPLPIFVPLAAYAKYLRDLPSHAEAEAQTLSHYLSHYHIRKQAGFKLPKDFFTQILVDGRDVLLLLDGLDEVANDEERALVRQEVENLVSGRPGLRVIVTCRTIAYREQGTALGADFREIAVQPLDWERHIQPMIRQAYACIYPKDQLKSAERADDLLQGIQRLETERKARLGEKAPALVDSPLMVRLLLIVHFNDHTLPNQRAELFERAINALLQVDYLPDVEVINQLKSHSGPFREMAMHLAFHMHSQGQDQGRVIDERALIRLLDAEPKFQAHRAAFVAQARQRGSLLEELDGQCRFIHLAFQEFLVAEYIWGVIGTDGCQAMVDALKNRLDDPWWREPILLLAGYLGAKHSKWAELFIQGLGKAGEDANQRFAAVELAGMAALEWRESGDALKTDCAKRIVELLGDEDGLKDSKTVIRARAGDRLAALGDPRFDPQRFYLPNDELLGFVHVPADPDFIIGTRSGDFDRVMETVGISQDSRKNYQDEMNDQPTPTREFYIARYPVTVAQFRAFVETTEFELGNEKALRDPDNRPVRYVSWHEALEYCRWLNGVLQTSTDFASCELAEKVRSGHWQVTLPNELEWEKAARGGLTGTIFPWGDTLDPNRANYGETNIGDTSPVGCFPPNDYGLYDMVGNVWEWTRSLWGFDYPYSLDDLQREDLKAGGDKSRVVRGGSWHDIRGFSRCAVRGRNRPDNRYFSYGFRVVVVLCSPPVV
ncbi:MAG: SUMF1/EgtB/PvdO family nonheme iron enzyme [Proteobacteria bacterium]|nr:SUMF1/EgtB/PvdO family nonheme iron enzyme [Pseudomonadota bacterium]